MIRVLSYKANYGIVFSVTCILTLGLCSGALATTVCDTDPAAVLYTPTVDPSPLNALFSSLGSIPIIFGFNVPIRLLYNHTLNLTLNAGIDLGDVDFIVTPGFGFLEVELAIPIWSKGLSVNVSHAACRNCDSEYNACIGDCDDDYDECCNFPGCELICGPLLLACQTGCVAKRGVCEIDRVACLAEAEAIDLLLDEANVGVGFTSATVTQTADICVSGDCEPLFPLESTEASLNDFHLYLLPETDPFGIGKWLNEIISGLVPAEVIENILSDFFESDGEGLLINVFGLDIATDGCLPVKEVMECTGACSMVDRPAGMMVRRSANVLSYGLPVTVLLGLILWRRRR